MIRSNSDSTTTSTASPTPISPFSSYSVTSDPTSDELPDLGAFTTVFRALNHLQPPLRSFTIPIPIPGTESNESVPISHSEGDSIIGAYLASRSRDTEEDLSSDEEYDSGSGSDTEGEPEGRLVEIEGFSDVDADGQPSLGYLDEALSFIASERARYAAQRDKFDMPLENAWRHVIEPRRKRRRKRSKATPTDTTTEGADDSPSSSSLDHDAPPSSYPFHKSTPGTPGRSKDKRHRRRALRHSKSTPNLDNLLVLSSSSVPALDPRVLQLRSLTHKLRLLFPEDSAALSTILSRDFPNGSEFIDPRGPVPGPQDTLVHVFIDHSNILIGLLTYLKRYQRHHTPTSTSSRKPKHMSHAALALILERGRPITRRCVVTSSPLYQSMESAEQLGYEVRVYARVPDLGDGDDRRKSAELGGSMALVSSASPGKGHWRKNSGGGGTSFKKGHVHKASGGNTSTESELGAANTSFPQAFIRSLGSQTTIRPSGPSTGSQQAASTTTVNTTTANTTSISTNTTGNGNGTPTAANTPGVRIRYREQGVDELLQLKLHQAIADVDIPPPNATIVLATGDGNVGQFNEDGFLGPVRTALKKGWKVELYAWEEGLSKAWMREFGEGPWKDRFRIISMETFGADLMEV